ncbi:hypothetical protein ABPG72_019524 [Tetrahymena utriculariae]
MNSFKPAKSVNQQLENFNQLNTYIFFINGNHKFADSNTLIVMVSFNQNYNEDTSNSFSSAQCEMQIYEFLLNGLNIEQTKIYIIIEEQQFQIGCSFNCMELQEVQIYKNLVIYQEKILPNFAQVLSGDTLFYSKQKIIKRYNIYPKFNIIIIEYSTQLDQTNEYQTNIQLIKYPQNEELFNYQVNQICNYIVANIIEIYNTLIFCDSNILNIYDQNKLSSKVFNNFNILKICKVDTAFIKLGSIKGSFIAQCKLAFSEYDPIIYINGQGIYAYQNNSFTSYPELVFDIFKVEITINNLFGNIEQKQQFIENNYKQYQTTLKLNSQNYFFEQNYFIALNKYQNQEILQVYNYLVESIISFQEAEDIEFSSQYYIDCTGFNKMLITYTTKIVGFNQPFSQSNDPFFTYNIGTQHKNFNIQLCTDEHLILLVNLTSSNMPRYEIQVISYETQSLIKTYSIKPNQLIQNDDLKKVVQTNWYQKQKGIAQIQNIIISLIQDGSDLLYVLSTLDFVYDDINDYGIIIDNNNNNNNINNNNNNFIQVIDFSQIFPFNLNSYSFANDVMIGPYLYGYTNKTTNQYQNKQIIFYNSFQNAIFFNDFDDETETKLQLDDTIIQNNHQTLYNIEQRSLSDDIDPQKDPQFPTETLVKKLNFDCLFNNYAVIFNKEKIIQYLPIANYDKNIPEGSLKFDDSSQCATFVRIKINNITHQYEIEQRHINIPTNIDLGKILHTVFYSKDLLLYLAFIDSNGYFVVDENVFIKLPEDYSVDKINLFDIILIEMNTLSGSILDAILEENYQYSLLITSNTLMVYRYKLNDAKNNINQIEPLNRFNLLSRNQNKLSKINSDNVAVISKSQLSMFLLTSESDQYIYSIRNQNFNIIQNSVLFDDLKFLIILDVHRVYLYDVRSDDGEIVQIFYREYTHIKILYTGYYWENNRSFIRLIGITATNVFDLRNEIKNLDNNVQQQIQYQKFQINNPSLKSLSSQCIQVDNLYSKILEQSQQIDYLVAKSHTKIYSIIFNVQYDNQVIQIPEKSYIESLTDGMKLIYNLNNKNNDQLFNVIDWKIRSFTGFINFENIGSLNITGFKVTDFPSEITVLSIIQIENVTIHNLTAQNLNWQTMIPLQKSADRRISIIDIYLALNFINISKVQIKNCTYDRVVKINSTIFEIYDFIQQVQFSKNLTVNIDDITIKNLKSKGTAKFTVANYNLLQLQVSSAFLSNIVAKNLNEFTSCFYFQKMEQALVKNMSISQIQNAQNIISFSQIGEQNFYNIQVINFTNILNCFYQQNSQIKLSKIKITNPFMGNLYVYDSAIKITFYQTSSSILIKDTVIQNIQNQRGNGTAINIIKQEVTDNKAVFSGGGIYLLMSQIELNSSFKDHDIKQSIIKNNFAQIGGGIRYICNFMPKLIQKNHNIISENSTRFYGSDYTIYPKQIQIIKDQNYQQVSSSLLSIKQKVRFYWIVEQGDYLKYYNENDYKLIGAIKKNEGEGQQYIEIDSQFLLSPKQKSTFYIYAPFKYIPMSLKADKLNLSKPISAEFRDKEQKCQICPDYQLLCEGNQIIAMQGFWRQSGTDIIEECFNQPLKCTRIDPNQYQCSEGGFGPRCESCDYSNFIFKGYYYGKSGRYNCSKFEKKNGFAKEIVITIFLQEQLIFKQHSVKVGSVLQLNSLQVTFNCFKSCYSLDLRYQTDLQVQSHLQEILQKLVFTHWNLPSQGQGYTKAQKQFTQSQYGFILTVLLIFYQQLSSHLFISASKEEEIQNLENSKINIPDDLYSWNASALPCIFEFS